MKDIKYYCDFCGDEFPENIADGNFRDDDHIKVEVTVHYGVTDTFIGQQKHTCVKCLIKIITRKETVEMRKYVIQAKYPKTIGRPKPTSIDDEDEDDFPGYVCKSPQRGKPAVIDNGEGDFQ